VVETLVERLVPYREAWSNDVGFRFLLLLGLGFNLLLIGPLVVRLLKFGYRSLATWWRGPEPSEAARLLAEAIRQAPDYDVKLDGGNSSVAVVLGSPPSNCIRVYSNLISFQGSGVQDRLTAEDLRCIRAAFAERIRRARSTTDNSLLQKIAQGLKGKDVQA